MLYTRKGDDGTTETFGCDQERISKNSSVAEALGSLDEVNSFLGLCKVGGLTPARRLKGGDGGSDPPVLTIRIGKQKRSFTSIIHEIQQNLFIVQAELGGDLKTIRKTKIVQIEKIIDFIEKELPSIKTFFVSGGSELAALFDIARTLSRRAERRVVLVHEIGAAKVGIHTLAYLNRLSSVLYALARLVNYRKGVTEEVPTYA